MNLQTMTNNLRKIKKAMDSLGEIEDLIKGADIAQQLTKETEARRAKLSSDVDDLLRQREKFAGDIQRKKLEGNQIIERAQTVAREQLAAVQGDLEKEKENVAATRKVLSKLRKDKKKLIENIAEKEQELAVVRQRLVDGRAAITQMKKAVGGV